MGILYDRYGRALFGVAYRIVRSREISEDLLQESLLSVWTKIESYDSSRGALFTWMSTIVRNNALDHVRSRAHRDSQKNYDHDSSVSLLEKESGDRLNPDVMGLQDQVDALDEDLRNVVDALFFRGCTHREAADELALPLGTVKTRARRAISNLREIFRMSGTPDFE